MAETLPTPQQPPIKESHEFGPGVLDELSTKLYKNPLAALREAVSNSFDAMSPYEMEIDPKIKIYTNLLPDGDIIIEDWGTGIENYQNFKTISPGKKQVKDEISSYHKVNEKIIGQKGMGKLSFLNLSNEKRVEFFSNNEQLGMHIVMTMDGFTVEYKNSLLILPHRGLKVVIKRAKHISEARLIDMLSKTFAIRLARRAKVFVNGKQVHKPEGFDPHQFKLFDLEDGIPVYGHLKHVEKPKPNNIAIFVKRVFVEDIYKDTFMVEGWLNCDHLEPRTDRDGLLEGSELYVEFYKELMQYLEENFEKRSESKDRVVKSGKDLEKMFVDVIRTILYLDPNMASPLMSGNISDGNGIGSKSNIQGNAESCCILQEGFIVDPTKTAERIVCKPIGGGKGHPHGPGESTAPIIKGEGKILAPSGILLEGNNMIPKLTVVEVGSEGKPIVYFSPPNRLVINSKRPSSKIVLEANTKDPIEMKSRVLPLLVRAGIDAFPKSSEMSKEDWLKWHDSVLDSMWSK
jgi:Histidine kinase-, DNA gyrase B-, and HSP90-like ATPase